jgi:DNA-binding YbaB/EbfC family protein
MAKGLDINQLMQQAQQMQAEMAKAQDQLKDEVVEASAGGGMVKVTMTGDMTLKGISISPEAIDPDDPDLLSDMVTAAVSEAIRSAQSLAESKLGGIAGMGGGLPGGGGIPGLGG